MKFIISSKLLLKHLNSISGVIATNPVVPILDNFLFEITPGSLKITASDLHNSIVTRLPIEIDASITIAVPSKKLLDTLKNMENASLSFTFNMETYGIEITSDNGKYKLTGENADDFPAISEVDNSDSMIIPSSVMNSAISSTLFATSNDELRLAMTGVYLIVNDSSTTFVSTDGHRLAKYKRNDLTGQEQYKMILPKKVLNLLKSNLPSENTNIQLEFNGELARLSFDNLQITCKIIDEKYPNFQEVIPLDNNNIMTINRLELFTSLKRVMIFSNQITFKVNFNIAGNQLLISTEDFEFSNEAKERLKCDHRGEDIIISFNAKLLLEIVTNIDDEEIQFSFSNSNKGVIVQPAEQDDNEDILMLTMPVTA